ncbi:MAG: TonB-dependent receptor [Acidobacteria bacterium]|nr:TonB-dependent receptor [Acidobacteriota bacterium]
MLRSLFLVFSCFFLLQGAIFALEINGIVLGIDDSPVAEARVEVLETGQAERTDRLGEFSIRNLDAGNYTVVADSRDFSPIQVQMNIIEGPAKKIEIRFTAPRRIYTSIEVVGRSEDLLAEIPGSVFLISREEMIDSKPLDANEVFRRVPGITAREDSGPVAMRLNIGMRGLNPDRSRKVLMLEDGLPISLAPYGEPEMYYSPPIDRMERVEVLKGSGQIAYGPQTIGGVINFITPEPPNRFHGELDVEGGQRDLFNGRALVGSGKRDGSAAWNAQYLHKQGDGWRQFNYDLDDLNAKLMLKPDNRNTVTVKGGVYDERSNSTYLGLTQPMFDADPNQNPVSGDELKVRRESAALLHMVVLDPNTILSSAVFGYHTVRNWGRQDFDRSDGGRDYREIVGDTSMPGGALFLRDSAGNRDRQFWVAGAQSNLAKEHNWLGIRGKLDAGVRYVYEQMEDKHVNGTGFRARTGLLRDDEDRFGNAFAAFLQNRFFLGDRVIFTPGLRLEHYNYERFIQVKRVGGVPTNVDLREDHGITTLVPGAGLSLRAANDVTLFVGAHRGFAPPITKNAISSDGENLNLDAELSWNYEAGIRISTPRVRGEFTWFRMDFSNQVITAAESGGATTELINGGESLHQGLESSLRLNWHEFADIGNWTLFTDLRHTYLRDAHFVRNVLYEGNRLPYAPRNQFSFLVGARRASGLGVQFDMSYVADRFGDNNETALGSADGTVGLLPSYRIANAMVDWVFRRDRFDVTPYFTIKNLADELYIASRAPEGIQPGMFRQTNFGLKFTF